MYMPDVKNLHSLLRNIKSSARKRNSLSVEIWNEILQEVGIPNEESFFKSKGDNWKVPDKPYRYLRLSFKSMLAISFWWRPRVGQFIWNSLKRRSVPCGTYVAWQLVPIALSFCENRFESKRKFRSSKQSILYSMFVHVAFLLLQRMLCSLWPNDKYFQRKRKITRSSKFHSAQK